MNLVTIAFADKEGSQVYIHLPWVAGKRLRHYLHDTALRQYNLVGRALRSRLVNQARIKLRLTSSLPPGETVHVVSVRRVPG